MKTLNIWSKDSFLFGALIGLIVPIVMYIILDALEYGFIEYIISKGGAIQLFGYTIRPVSDNILPDDTQLAVSVAGNLFFFRHYMVKTIRDKTGRGILMMTFLFAFLYIALFFLMEINRISIFR